MKTSLTEWNDLECLHFGKIWLYKGFKVKINMQTLNQE